MRYHPLSLLALLLGMSCLPAFGTAFTLDQVTDVVAPSTRDAANTTYFGWELFDDASPINDSTPDLPVGNSVVGANFQTINGESHRFSNGNIYFMAANNTLAEQVTVPTAGTVGATGTTTIIAQFVTSSGDFASNTIYVSTINGIQPTVVRAVNAAGKGQVWAKWQLPGNAASYVFTVTGPASTPSFSIDRLIVDTHWDLNTPQPDMMRATQPLDQATGLYTPSKRGTTNATYFGWDTFADVDNGSPINDSTPDINTGGAPAGVLFATTNGEDHVSGSANLYVPNGQTLAEEVTITTNGTVDAGFTTVIAQAITAFGDFPAELSFGKIEGVDPVVVQSANLVGSAQVWAKWKIPGNKLHYTFTLTGPANEGDISITKFIVDTYWNATSYAADNVIKSTPTKTFALDDVANYVAPAFRGTAYATWFGWETFDEKGSSAPIDDSTPNIGTTTTGVNFKTVNAEDHVAGSGNFFIGTSTLSVDEEVTIATVGTEDSAAGTTTIVAQVVSQFASFPFPLQWGSIEGVAPVVVTGANMNGLAQVWVKWVLPGNKPSYKFTIKAPAGASQSTAYSFDRLVIDTVWSPTGEAQNDSMLIETPAIASAMSQISNLVNVSSRGRANSTWFGWDKFNDNNNRGVGVAINDSTPDIGTTTTAGANFQTTNGQDHMTDDGNLYSGSLALAEQITVPTKGTVGSAGFTTIIVQIMSASNGPDSHFSDVINLSPINGVSPVIVQDANSLVLGQLYAVYKIPGNQATYTINISGSSFHYSFDRVMVDTFFSTSGYLKDSMALLPVSIAQVSVNNELPQGIVGLAYTAPVLTASGGTAPYTWSVSSGDLPAGLTLSAGGAITGTPTALGESTFTVKATDSNGLASTQELTIETITNLVITTSSLPGAVKGFAYAETVSGTGGSLNYAWSVSDGSLPAGLALNETSGAITGTPTATTASVSNFTVKMTDTANTFFVTKAFSISTTLAVVKPVLDPVSLGSTTIGVEYGATITAANYPTAFTFAGLPKGLKSTLVADGTNAKKAVLSGKASVSGVFNVKITASNKAGASTAVTVPLIVKALPNGFVGSFIGIIARDASNNNLGGLLTLTTGVTGNFTAKAIVGNSTKQVMGFLLASAPQVSITLDGKPLSLTLNKDTNLLTGTHGAAAVTGWRSVWDKTVNPATHRIGYYSAAIDLVDEADIGSATVPQGYGYATFTVAPAGTLTVAGKTADNQTVTTAGFVGPSGQIAVYTSLYGNQGSVIGQWSLSEDAEGLFTGNTVAGTLTWKKPAQPALHTYPDAFGTINLSASGKYLAPAASGYEVLGLPDTGLADLLFEGVGTTATNPNVTGFAYTDANKVVLPAAANNKAGATLAINKATGAVTGKFTLVDNGVKRVVKAYYGQTVRLADGSVKAVGFVLVPQIPGTGQTAATAPVISGALTIEQPASAGPQ